jgi:ankyrin repeat protein
MNGNDHLKVGASSQSEKPTEVTPTRPRIRRESNSPRSIHYPHFIAQNDYFNSINARIKAIKEDHRQDPLHFAACIGDVNAIKAILATNIEVNAYDKHGATPLHYAVYTGHTDAIRCLLAGADSDARDQHEVSPLHFAAFIGDIQVMSMLLAAEADVDAFDEHKTTPLHAAAYNGHVEAIRCLLASDAYVNAQNIHYATPLHLAASIGGFEAIKDDESKDTRVLASDASVRLHSNEAVRLLLHNGAFVWAVDEDDRTPLHEAARAGSEDAISQLIAAGADVNAVDMNGQIPLHDATGSKSKVAVSALLESGSEVNTTDKNGRTPLHNATRAGFDFAVSELLSRCADVNAIDKSGRTPFHNAARAGSELSASSLMFKRARTTVVDHDGRTPLHEACLAGSGVITSWLLRSTGVNAIDKAGRTPLHYAACAGSEATISNLLCKGADVMAVDDNGQTPLHEAVPTNLAGVICQLIHPAIQESNLNEYGLLNLRKTVKPLGSSESKEVYLLTHPSSIVQFSSFEWDGLSTYLTCETNIGDILTISRINPEKHSYIARSISEYLCEMHSYFGEQLLDWITSVCANVVNNRCLPQSRYLRTSRNHLQKTPADLRIRPDSPNDDIVVLSGILRDRNLTLILSTESEHAMSEVKSALIWLLTVLQPREDDALGLFSLSLDQDFIFAGLPKPKRFTPESPDRYCWTELFSYAVVVEIPPLVAVTRPKMEGLEIELSILVELAAVDRQATIYNGVTMLYGFDSAIFPLWPIETRRWHLITTNDRQITPRRAEIKLSEYKLDRFLTSEYQTGMVYIGWCPNLVVSICSAELSEFSNKVLRPSGVLPGQCEDVRKRKSIKTFIFRPRLELLALDLTFSTKIRREKKYKEVIAIAKRTRSNNYEGILSAAMGTPSILWDNNEKLAWLLPAISVLAYACIRLTECERYSFFVKGKKGKLTKTDLVYATEMKNTGSEAQAVLRKNSSLIICEAGGENINQKLSFRNIVRDIWEKMCDGEDLCISKLSGLNYADDEGIFGYDLSEAVSRRCPQVRKLPYSRPMRSWLPLCQFYRTQIIFSQSVGRMISCDCKSFIVDRNAPRIGTLTCLFEDLKFFYGSNWNTPYPEPESRGFPIGRGFEWIPRGYEEETEGCSSEIYQSITKKGASNFFSNGEVEIPIVQLPQQQCLIRFGEDK